MSKRSILSHKYNIHHIRPDILPNLAARFSAYVCVWQNVTDMSQFLAVRAETSGEYGFVFVSLIWLPYRRVPRWRLQFCTRASVSAGWFSAPRGRHDSLYLWQQNIAHVPMERANALKGVAAVFPLPLPETAINSSTCGRRERRKPSRQPGRQHVNSI